MWHWCSYGHACIADKFLFVITLQLSESLTPWDVLLSLIAAATHDLDHPGVNQPFLIKTNHYLATLYKVRRKSVALLKSGLENSGEQKRNINCGVFSLL